MKSFSREQNQKYFEKYLGPLKPNCKGEAKMRCPFHKDQNPSMGVNLDKGVWHCFVCQLGGGPIQFEMRIGQCDRAEARRRLRAFSGSAPPFYNTSRDNIVATYDYTDENGIVLKQVVRRESKKFSQRRPDGNGGWINCVTGIRNVPYQLAEVLRATEVFVVEGEKDVESLRQLGLVATTNAGGAGNWPDDFRKYLVGKRTIIPPDNDPAGRDRAQKVARNLHPVAVSVKLLELPGLAPKGDITDWLRAGNTAEKLKDLVLRCPEWHPPKETTPSDQAPPRGQPS